MHVTGPRSSVQLWPAAAQQRCTVHALRNLLSKLPERHHTEFKARWWRIFDEAASPGEAKSALLALAAEYRRAYPSAIRTIDENADELVSHLLFPSEHRKRLRSTNLLERTFVEVRRRTNVRC